MAHETPSCKGAASGEDRDPRYLVLLVCAVLLLLAQWTESLRPAWHGGGEGETAPMDSIPLWLTGSRIESGLYLLPAEWLASGRGLTTLYQELGLTPPVDDLDMAIDSNLAPIGLLLEDLVAPAKVAVPARVQALLFQPLPINRASEEEIAMLPGIGPRLAERIVATREKQGGFAGQPELLKVPGLGEKKLARLSDLISVE